MASNSEVIRMPTRRESVVLSGPFGKVREVMYPRK